MVKKSYNHSHREDTVKKMERTLMGKEVIHEIRVPYAKNTPVGNVVVASISRAGFERISRIPESEIFVTSISEIEHVISELSEPTERDKERELEEIRQVIQPKYYEYADVFSKIRSDTLPPHRKGVDHKIKLEEKATPGYCPLYKMSMEQLEAAKTYIYENLHKGFIVPSNAPFASPILMAKKADGGLRFCVDFRKLNSVIKKDLYPLPLIDEMM